ncbi:MAG TPA: adenosylmethionine decarboxylase [Candidatus Obscuribacterales bacterium]
MFGPHLILEAYGCPKELLGDLGLMSQTLDAYPAKLDMTKIMPPYVFTYHGTVPEDWGVSGVVLIAESHISIHTFPEKGFVTLDIFSCRAFDVEAAVDYFSSVFKPEKVDKEVLMRGREFPRSLGRAGSIVEAERLKVASGA